MTLFYLAVAWLCGVGVAYQAIAPWWAWLILSALATAGVILARGKPSIRLAFGCILVFGMGAARLSLAIPSFGEGDLASYNGRGDVIVEGVIDDDPVARDTIITFTVRAKKITLPDQQERAVDGLLLVTATAGRRFQYGDRVSLQGDLQAPPTGNQFSYRDYLARAGIFSMMRYAQARVQAHDQGNPVQAALLRVRDSAALRIKQLMPDPEASLMQGILLGNDNGISSDVRDAFSAVSATHIIAISGANMVVVAGFLQAVARRFIRESWVAVITLAGIVIYTVFVGANPAVVRAAIMVGLALVAARLGRQTYGPASLGFAAILMSMINPYVLWDVSFQLSFLATCGLIFYVEPLQRLLAKLLSKAFSEKVAGKIVGAISDAFVVTVAAQLTTTPIMALYFGRLSLLSLPVNFLIIPAQPPIMIFGGLGVMATYLFWPLGQVLSWVGWLFLAYTVFVVRLFAAIPFSSIAVTAISPALVVGFYILLLGATILGQQSPEQRRAWWDAARENISVKAVSFAGIVAALLIVIGGFSLPDGKLHVTVLDVGQGSAVLIRTPSGRDILVDAGGDGNMLSTALGDRLPFWKRQIDLVIITQPTEASSAGLGAVTDRYQIPVLMTNGSPGGQLFGSVQSRLQSEGTKQEIAASGSSIHIGDGVTFHVLNTGPQAASNGPGEPVSLAISYGNIRILLPGNISATGQQALLRADGGPYSQVLYIPSITNGLLTDAAFLGQIHPQVLIVALDQGAPTDPKVISQMALDGRVVYRTDEQGSIEVVTDGSRLWVQTGQ